MDDDTPQTGIVGIFQKLGIVAGAIAAIIGLYQIFFPEAKFILYENDNYGIKVNRHENWLVQENDSKITKDARFIEVKFKKLSNSNTCPIEMILNVDELQDSTLSLEEYKNLIIRRIKTNNPGSKIKDESNFSTTLSNHPAYKLTYRKQEDQCNSRVMESGTVWKSKAYYIVYIAKDDKYSKFLSTAEKMIKSFQFTDKN